MAKIVLIRAGLCLWLLAVGGGFLCIMKDQNTAGSTGMTPAHWPVGTQVQPDAKRDTLLMFVHPQCPCTRASMEELNRLLARSQGRVAAEVWFFNPEKFSDAWTKSELWRSAAAIPGVSVHEDRNGAEARLFGAETSGYVLLYDTRGQLLFKGGITGSRGHAGDNPGESAIVSILAGEKVPMNQTRVYGCSLLDKCVAPNEVASK